MHSPRSYSAIDYYPFGMEMPKRSLSATAYRFGYNGQMKDNEYTGQDGAHEEFKYREYDSRICRFWSMDPLFKEYPMLTPYQFASNTPIAMYELEGLEGALGIYAENAIYAPKTINTTSLGTMRLSKSGGKAKISCSLYL